MNETRAKLLTAEEVAKWLNLSVKWVYDHSSERRRPHIPCIRLGGSLRYRPEDVEQFIAEQRQRRTA